MSALFERDVSTILRWIANVFDEGELEGKSNLQKMQISSSDKLFMGLSAFSGNQVTKKDIGVAKNYLTEDELQNLNMLVSGYFDIAELRAVRHIPTTMQDFIEQLDQVLTITDSPVLSGSGKRSHKQAMAKAEEEYRKYQIRHFHQLKRNILSS